MLNWAVYAMVYIGSALMVYNVYSYIRYAKALQKEEKWGRERHLLYIPIFLLIMFLLGYLAVGIFGHPDLIVSGILFGGSIFVCIIFYLLQRITRRIQENERLEGELIAAERSSRAKTDFMSRMSHEMRTPLNAIIGLDTLVLRNPALPEECRGRCKKIGLSARHLLEMISNILDMSDIEEGALTLKNGDFSLRETLELADIITQNLCDEKGLAYRSSVIGPLDDYYVGDEAKLRQVLLSVLGNAVKFTSAPGSVTFTAEQIDARDGARALCFTVRDTGVGIEEKYLPDLFTPFKPGDDSAGSRFGGSGLGLAISKKIVNLMQGDIAVDSKPGEGSTFTVTVELGASEKTGAPPAREGPAAEDEADSLQGRRVLIVEDMELNAEIVSDLLDMEGVITEWAENGQVAVDMFAKSKSGYYDAVLMDLRMPIMDGLEAARAIRAMNRYDAQTVPILALTANAFEEDVRKTMEAGMNVHMSKPVDAEQLYGNLRRLIPRRQAADAQ